MHAPHASHALHTLQSGTLELVEIRQLPRKLQELQALGVDEGDGVLKKEVLAAGKEGKERGGKEGDGLPKDPPKEEAGPLSGMLLLNACSGCDANVVTLYEQMITLVYKAPAATRERFIRQVHLTCRVVTLVEPLHPISQRR